MLARARREVSQMVNLSSVLMLVVVGIAGTLAACNGTDGGSPTATMTAPPTETPASQNATVSPAVAGEEGYLLTVDVVKVLKPSVVQIVTESLSMNAANQAVPSRGVGTGVILDEQGHILTNNHVIRDAQRIMVTLNNGDSFPAQLIGGDANTDTAVIRIDAPNLRRKAIHLHSW